MIPKRLLIGCTVAVVFFFLPRAALLTAPQEGLPELQEREPGPSAEAGLARPPFRSEGQVGAAAPFHLSLPLESNEFLQARVIPERLTELNLELRSPDGEILWQGSASLPLLYIAPRTGIYTLVVGPLKEGPPLEFLLVVEQPRPAHPEDEACLAAAILTEEARRKGREGTKEAREEALGQLERAQLLWEDCPQLVGRAEAYHLSAQLRSVLGYKAQALELLQQELALRKEIGEALPVALALNEMGLIQRFLGQLDQAVQSYQQALQLYQGSRDLPGLAAVLHNLGAVHYYQGDLRQARDYYNRSLSIKNQVGDRAGAAYTLFNLASLASVLGNWKQARRLYEQAFEVRRQLGDVPGQASVAQSLGALHAQLGEYDQALRRLFWALDQMERAGDRVGVAYCLHTLGYVYGELGEYEIALDYYLRALRIREELGDLARVASTLNNIAYVQQQAGDLGEAEATYRRALDLKRQGKDPYGEAYVLANLASLAEKADLSKAMRLQSEALRLHRQIGNRGGEASALVRLAGFKALEDPREGLSDLRQALALFRETEDREGEAEALRELSRLYLRLDEPLEALQTARASLRLAESVHSRLANRNVRISHLNRIRRHYEHFINLLMELEGEFPGEGHLQEAFQAGERSRARVLLESLMGGGPLPSTETLQPSSMGNLQELEDRISILEGERRWLLRRGRREKAEALEEEIGVLLGKHRLLTGQLQDKNPHFAVLTASQVASFEKIQQELLSEGEVLLEYFLGEEKSWLWLVTRQEALAFPLPPRSQVEEEVRQFHQILSGERPSQNLLPFQEKLAQLLLPPALRSRLASSKRLLVVADGALHFLPFGALAWTHDQEGISALIVDRFEIVHLPSASVGLVLRRHRATQRRQLTLALFADPVFRAPQEGPSAGPGLPQGTDSTHSQALLREVQRWDLSSLPGSAWEAKALIELVPAEQRFVATRFSANLDTLYKVDLRQFRFLHFATHGILNSSYPELSGLVFSLVDEQGARREGILWAHEIYRLRLEADLAVLSGCQTGLGRVTRGEGLLGLSHAFLYSGARRVLASLWRISDEATAAFMKAFYRALLQQKLPPSRALQRAQQWMKSQWRWREPRYWAAFILVGG